MLVYNQKLQILNLMLLNQKFSFLECNTGLTNHCLLGFLSISMSFWLCLLLSKYVPKKKTLHWVITLFQLKQTRNIDYRNKNITNAQIEDVLLFRSVIIQTRIYNPLKHPRWGNFVKIVNSCKQKSSIVDVPLGSKDVSVIIVLNNYHTWEEYQRPYQLFLVHIFLVHCSLYYIL